MLGLIDPSRVMVELGLGESATEVQRATILQAIARAEAAVRRHLRYDPAQATRVEYYPQANFNQGSGEGVWETNDTSAYFRRLSGSAGDTLFVRHVPIRSITQLCIDYDGRNGTRSGAFGAGTVKTEGSDFWPNYDGVDSSSAKVCRDGIIHSHGLWPTEPGSVKIAYIAGYSVAELSGGDSVIDASAIQEAVLIESVLRARRSLGRAYSPRYGFAAGPLQSESLGDYSYSVGQADKGMAYGSGTVSAETREMLEAFVNFGYELAG